MPAERAYVPTMSPSGLMTADELLRVHMPDKQEVLSPHDRPGDALAKVADWLSDGTRVVWVVDPVRRLARVYRHDGGETTVMADGALDGEDVLPGFHCPLGDVL